MYPMPRDDVSTASLNGTSYRGKLRKGADVRRFFNSANDNCCSTDQIYFCPFFSKRVNGLITELKFGINFLNQLNIPMIRRSSFTFLGGGKLRTASTRSGGGRIPCFEISCPKNIQDSAANEHFPGPNFYRCL